MAFKSWSSNQSLPYNKNQANVAKSDNVKPSALKKEFQAGFRAVDDHAKWILIILIR